MGRPATTPSASSGVHLGTPSPLVPGPGLPPGVVVGRSNNNVDLASHEGELFLAWRTAPTHFAHRDAAIHVLRGRPGGWHHELTVAVGRDVREPRLVSWRGRLLLYWFTAGTAALRFEPDRVWAAARSGPGSWGAPERLSDPDHVVWRVRPVGDRLLMSLSRHAASLYTRHPRPLSVELWGSDDGLDWTPLDPAHPEVHHGGAEADFLDVGDGSLAVVVRKEGPAGGGGSDVGWAAAAEPTRWHLRPDPRKLDSPFLFREGRRVFLVCRRQVAFGGRFDLGWTHGSAVTRTKAYQALYSATPKRTALYEVHHRAGAITHVSDLPSAGDTAFAGGVRTGEGRWLVANYTSRLDRGWWPWAFAQTRPTSLSTVEITIDT